MNNPDDKTLVVPAEALPKERPIPQIPDHTLLKQIGAGAYGEVWLAKNVMGTFRAVKIVYRASFENERPYEREFAGIKKFEPISRSHDGFVDILHIGRNDEAGYFYYVMELGDDQSSTAVAPASAKAEKPPPSKTKSPGTAESAASISPDTYNARTLWSDLKKRGRLSFEECLQIGLNLTGALAHLHNNGLIHRDIKPSNIIFVHGLPKLADIGLVADASEARTFVGTEGYIPPEGPGTVQADIFSLGKVFYEMATGKDRNEFPELPTQVDEPKSRAGLAELNEVIVKACDADMRKRYATAEEFHSDLLLLQSGKSVRRNRTLKRTLKVLKYATVIVGLPAVVLVVLHSTSKFELDAWRKKMESRGEKLSFDLVTALPNATGQEQTKLLTNLAAQLPEIRVEVNTMRFTAPGLATVSWAEDAINFETFERKGRGPAKRDERITSWSDLERMTEPAKETLAKIRHLLKAAPKSCNAPFRGQRVSYYVSLRDAAQWLRTIVIRDLHEKKNAAALQNFQALAATSRFAADDVLLIDVTIRSALMNLNTDLTWEMLQANWNDSELQQMQQAFQTPHGVEEMARAILLERDHVAFYCDDKGGKRSVYQGMWGEKIGGWARRLVTRYISYPYWHWVGSYRDELHILTYYQPIIENQRLMVKAQAELLSSGRTTTVPWTQLRKDLDSELVRLNTRLEEIETAGLFKINFLSWAIPNYSKAFQTLMRNETKRELAFAAVGLKRFHLRHGKYPAQLSELVPSILPRLPIDYMNGKPLHYRLNPEGSPVLYSVGEDGDSDDGDPSPTNPGKRYEDIWSGHDAVWPAAIEKN